MATVQEVTLDIVFNGKSAQRGLTNIRDLVKQISNIGKSRLVKTFAKIAGVAAFSKMTIDAMHLGRQMGILSDRTGVAAENLSAMRNAFKAVGGEAGSLDRVVGGLSKGLARLSVGDGETAAKLAAMNISAWDASGRIRKPDELLFDISDWAKRQLDTGRSREEVASYLEDAFGIDYKLFQQLAKGSSEYRKELESIPKTTKEESAALESLSLSFSKLSAIISNTATRALAALAPAIEWVANMATKVAEFAGEWPKATATIIALIGLGGTLFSLLPIVKLLGGALVAAGGAMSSILPILAGIASFFAGRWVGKKVGDFLGEAVADAVNGVDLEDKNYWGGIIDKLQKEGKITEEQANIERERHGLSKKESLFQSDYVPVDGTEVMKASNSGKDTFVDVSVDNNWIENPDGTYTIMTDIDVDSSDGSSFTTNISKALNGGHA